MKKHRICHYTERSGRYRFARSECQYRAFRKCGQAKELAELLEMECYFSKSIDYKGGDYDNMILSKYPLSNKRRFELPMPVLGEKRSVAFPSCFKRRVYFLNHEVMKTMKSFIKSFNETMSGRLKRDGSESRFLLAVTTSLCMDTIGFILSKSDLSTGYIDLPNPYLSSLYSYISSMYPFIESM